MKTKHPNGVNTALHNPFPLPKPKPNGRYSFISPNVPVEDIEMPETLRTEKPRLRVKK
jgi:hypothetical protein